MLRGNLFSRSLSAFSSRTDFAGIHWLSTTLLTAGVWLSSAGGSVATKWRLSAVNNRPDPRFPPCFPDPDRQFPVADYYFRLARGTSGFPMKTTNKCKQNHVHSYVDCLLGKTACCLILCGISSPFLTETSAYQIGMRRGKRSEIDRNRKLEGWNTLIRGPRHFRFSF